MESILARKSFRRLLTCVSLLTFLFLPCFPTVSVLAAQPVSDSFLSDVPAGESVAEAAAEAAAGPQVDAPAALVMEASTGTVLYEQNADEKRPPASVTKVMTLLLIFEALDAGQISLDDTVTTSEHAASMGGSQVFLETGEPQTVDTLIKCIAVASGNDAAVAMAEYIAGSEEAFVAKMNERAAALGMKNTHFVNCCGLDADGHETTARDIALMSRELTTKHPAIFDYTTIWMENITHVTTRGTSEFGLTNTNKLIRQYEGANGLKTGSTSKAGFCLSATATRNEISLIAVVMGCESSKSRTADVSALLDYGFSVCHLYTDQNPPALSPVPLHGGTTRTVSCRYEGSFSFVATSDISEDSLQKKLRLDDDLTAPVKKGQKIGSLDYYHDGTKLGTVSILAEETVPEARYTDCLIRLLRSL